MDEFVKIKITDEDLYRKVLYIDTEGMYKNENVTEGYFEVHDNKGIIHIFPEHQTQDIEKEFGFIFE